MWEEVKDWLGWIVGGIATAIGYIVGWNKSSSEAFNQRIDALVKIIKVHEDRITKLEEEIKQKDAKLRAAYKRIRELEQEIGRIK